MLNGGQISAGQDAVPLLMTAQPGGVRLAAFLRGLATKDDSPPAEAWAALRCLPHACEKPDQVRPPNSFLRAFLATPEWVGVCAVSSEQGCLLCLLQHWVHIPCPCVMGF